MSPAPSPFATPRKRVLRARVKPSSRQKPLFCACRERISAIAGLCSKWYRMRRHSRDYFRGNRETVLARDHFRCASCGGAGLRREEIVSIQIEHIQQREGRWVIADLIGKRKRIRTVPIPGWAKVAIDQWVTAAGISAGRLFRAVDKAGRITGQTLSSQAVYLIITDRAREIGLEMAPHDARRTFAKLAHKGRVPIEQIQLSLGHESIQTTERYLGVRQDLSDAPCDHLGIEME